MAEDVCRAITDPKNPLIFTAPRRLQGLAADC